ncbi:MAG: hypothetical protein KAT37_01375 [Candidatus Aenigmarchaeota archaeon]|nr:hypothetical protein [Candidatus Aenigmarchaeota archaeon]
MENFKVQLDIDYWKENIDDWTNKDFKKMFIVVELSEKKDYRDLEPILLEVAKETKMKVRVDGLGELKKYDNKTEDIFFDNFYKQFTLKKLKVQGKILVRNEEDVGYFLLNKEPNNNVKVYLNVLEKYVPLKRHRS